MRWNGGLVLDANHDERSDLFLVANGAADVHALRRALATSFPDERIARH